MAELSPIGWALRPLKKYATFSGRAPRAEFWWFFLFTMILYAIMWVALIGSIGGLAATTAEPSPAALGALGIGGMLMGLFWLAILIPSIAVQVRRIHDLNRSGWWIGAFYLFYLVYIFVMLGAAGAGSESGLAMVGLSAVIALAFLVYAVVLLVFFCMRGTEGPNRYGPDPYGVQDVGEVFA